MRWWLRRHSGTWRAVVVGGTRTVLWAAPGVVRECVSSVVVLLGLEVWTRIPLVMFSRSPSSTSAHSAGLERQERHWS